MAPLLCALGAAALAAAGVPGYEPALEAWGLDQVRRERDPAPEGKIIEEILVASEEVVARSDPYPRLLNIVHVRTRESVVRGELILKVGEPYQAQAAAETERNLRRLFILAIARVVPLQGRTPGGVGVLVVTKDLWSIRLNSEFVLVEGDLLQHLRIRPTEQNFLGLNKRVSLDFLLRLDTFSLGQVYVDDRFLGSPYRLVEQARVIFNRPSGAIEGTQGAVQLSLPLRTRDSPYGFYVAASWEVQRKRELRGANLVMLPYPSAQAPEALLPYVYDERNAGYGLGYTWSFGRDFKTNLQLATGGFIERTAPPPETPLTPEQREWLQCNYFPRNDQALHVSGQAHLYEARYAALSNVRSFALTEDYQLGHRLVASLRWAPLKFVEGGVSAQYRIHDGGNLFTASLGASARYMPGDLGCGVQGGWVNQRLAVEVNEVTPLLFGVGRLAFRALVDVKGNDLDHRPVYLGGSNGLRGLLAEALRGTQMALWNAELRTVPLNIFTLHAGLVLFWDAGAAFDQLDRVPALVHTVGIGLRLLFPQFDKEPVRIDFGYVVDGAPNPDPLRRISASFGQVDEIRPPILTEPLP